MTLLGNNWIQSAACRGVDVNIFFPDEDQPKNDVRSRELAMAYCKTCPVKNECRDYAISNNLYIGIYGGMSNRQRRLYRMEKRKV